MMLNQSGYAPGEVMRVTAEIDNKSDVTVDCVEVTLHLTAPAINSTHCIKAND